LNNLGSTISYSNATQPYFLCADKLTVANTSIKEVECGTQGLITKMSLRPKNAISVGYASPLKTTSVFKLGSTILGPVVTFTFQQALAQDNVTQEASSAANQTGEEMQSGMANTTQEAKSAGNQTGEGAQSLMNQTGEALENINPFK
jgi:hypothetical protein